jgi:acyl carrier protein
MSLTQQVLQVLDDALSLQGRALAFDTDTPLLGAVPELDSMGVLAVITGLESHFGIAFSDDDLNAAVFATVASVCNEVQHALDRLSP